MFKKNRMFSIILVLFFVVAASLAIKSFSSQGEKSFAAVCQLNCGGIPGGFGPGGIPLPPLPTGSITLVKVVSGGAKVPGDFTLFLSSTPGGGAIAGTRLPGSGVGNLFTLLTGAVNPTTYYINEETVANYTKTITEVSGGATAGNDCDLDGDGTGRIALYKNANLVCRITNTYTAPDPIITITKVVVNTGGGTKSVSDFTLSVGPQTVVSGVPMTIKKGTYTVTETPKLSNYRTTFSGACDASGNVTLANGDNKACTITNTYAPDPIITITKVVVNAGGGTKSVSDFTLSVGPQTVVSGVPMTIKKGTYTVTETPTLSDYTTTFSGACDASGKVTLANGDNKACTITNTYTPLLKTLKVIATVPAACGKSASDAKITVNGTGVVPAANPQDGVANPGKTYSYVTFSSVTGSILGGGYTGPTVQCVDQAWGKACEVAYGCTPPTTANLNVTTKVVNTGGGTATPNNFRIHVTSNGSEIQDGGIVGGPPDSPKAGADTPGVTYALPTGAYILTADAMPGFTGFNNYTLSFNSPECASGHASIAPGFPKNCVLTFTYAPKSLIVIATVPAACGKSASDAKITVNGTGVVPAANPQDGVANPGKTYSYVTFSSVTGSVLGGGYTGPTVQCIDQAWGKACEVAYACTPPTTANLNVTTKVVNTGGGTATSNNFRIHVTSNGSEVQDGGIAGGPPDSPKAGADTPGVTYALPTGAYVLTADAMPGFTGFNNYTLSFNSPECASGHASIAPGFPKNCILTFTYVPPAAPTHINFTVDKNEVVRGGFFTVTASWPEGTLFSTKDEVFPVKIGGTATPDDDYVTYFVPTIDTKSPPADSMVMPKGVMEAKTIIVNVPYKIEDEETIRIQIDGNERVVKLLNMGEGECAGEVIGETSKAPESQGDHGITNFDSHTDAAPGVMKKAILDIILPGEEGYAPYKTQAACVAPPAPDDTYQLKGYAWNDNLGFLSFYCNGTENDPGENLAIGCGKYSYGVTVGAAGHDDDQNKRLLTGFAYNSAFGYISFSGNLYEVIATSRNDGTNLWDLSGYAWTQAGVYMKMDGTAVELAPIGAENCTERTVSPVPYPCCLQNRDDFPSCTPVECEGKDGLALACCIADANNVTPFPEQCVDELCKGEAGQELECCLADVNNVTPLPEKCSEIRCGGLTEEAYACCMGIANPIDCTPHRLNCAEDAEDGTLEDPACCTEYPDMDLEGGGSCGDGYECSPPFVVENGICLLPVPNSSFNDLLGLDNLPVADCSDNSGYSLDLYIHGDGGVPKPYTNETFQLRFSWEDTVKLNQVDDLSPANESLGGQESPWMMGLGGIKNKPIVVDVVYDPITDSSNFDTLFTAVDEAKGHYRLTKRITSCAPTSGGNVSPLVTVEDALFDNEMFFGMKDLLKWNQKEPNRLVLRRIDAFVFDETGNYVGGGNAAPDEEPIYLDFRPAVKFNQLETSDLADAITAHRDVPFGVIMSIFKSNELVSDTAKAKLYLSYDSKGKPVDPTCSSDQFELEITGDGVSGTKKCTNDELGEGECSLIYDAVTGNKEIQITPKLPGENPICPRMVAPSIYSIVEYSKKINGSLTNHVKYYSNKLPRLDGSFLDNLAAIIHGTILSTMQFSTDVTQTYSPVGDVVSNVVRDTVHRNVVEYVKSSDEVKNLEEGEPSISDANKCIVNGMSKVGDSYNTVVEGACSGKHNPTPIMLGSGEGVDYFKNVNVVLGQVDGKKANENAFGQIGKRVLVVEGGDLVINKNVDDPNEGSQLVIVVMGVKTAAGVVGGDVYIADNVTTLANVAIVADGSVHPFPILEEDESIIFANIGENGVLKDVVDFYKEDHRSEAYQLFIKGAISAKTVAGIANTVKELDEKTYYLRGTNETITLSANPIFESMFFDWNAFRYYKGGDFFKSNNGMILDLSCGAYLSYSDHLAIFNGGEICGEVKDANPMYSNCTTCGTFADRCKCDGIQVAVNPGLGSIANLSSL